MHLMSRLIRIQFGPCYLDFEIPTAHRGSGDRAGLENVIRLGNHAACLSYKKRMANIKFHKHETFD